MPFARELLSELLELLAPSDCVACGADARAFLCVACRAALEPAPARRIGGAPVLSVGAYHAPLVSAVHRFKYGARPDLARPLAALLADAELRRSALDPRTLFVPVPLHHGRLVERGYDQAALLASALAGRVGRRARPGALLRLRATAQQARLERDARRANVVGAFAARPGAILPDTPVVLVDDVITTGATAGECSDVLRSAGALVVAMACVAVAADRQEFPRPPIDNCCSERKMGNRSA